VRSWNVRRVDRYIERVEAAESAVSSSEELGPWDREVERLMLGLRRAAGVTTGAAGACLLNSERGRLLVDAGILAVEGERLRIDTPLLADEVGRTLLALESDDC
jgi:coproporphyrinogen III oxidase-like Fe-S oxidoreductase